MIKVILVAAAILALSGTPAAGANIKVSYKCTDGTKLDVTFRNSTSGPGAVAISYPSTGKQIVLPQVLSADGGRYASRKTQFWVTGKQASFTRGKRNLTCKTKS